MGTGIKVVIAFLRSPLGQVLLILLSALLCWWAFDSWLDGKLKDEYKRGRGEAEAAYKIEKDQYFGTLQSSANLFAANSGRAADSAEAASRRAAQNITTIVANAVEDMKKNPWIVYNETTKKCEFQGNALGLRWSEVNRSANQMSGVKQ